MSVVLLTALFWIPASTTISYVDRKKRRNDSKEYKWNNSLDLIHPSDRRRVIHIRYGTIQSPTWNHIIHNDVISSPFYWWVYIYNMCVYFFLYLQKKGYRVKKWPWAVFSHCLIMNMNNLYVRIQICIIQQYLCWMLYEWRQNSTKRQEKKNENPKMRKKTNCKIKSKPRWNKNHLTKPFRSQVVY